MEVLASGPGALPEVTGTDAGPGVDEQTTLPRTGDCMIFPSGTGGNLQAGIKVSREGGVNTEVLAAETAAEMEATLPVAATAATSDVRRMFAAGSKKRLKQHEQ
ncbi:hypothetical protein Aduo_013865 [Ancylostoma duodenale]